MRIYIWVYKDRFIAQYSVSIMSAPVLDDQGANEEKTIARPLSIKNVVQFTFNKRYLLSFSNIGTAVNTTIQRLAVDQSSSAGAPFLQVNGLWVNYPFYVLPVKSPIWWMNSGEMALLLQFTKFRYCHAKMKAHNLSYRTQFVTGSNAIAFANSNMQMHSYLVEPNDTMPPYNVWTGDGLPGTAPPATPALLASALHGNEFIEPTTVATPVFGGAETYFQNWQFYPWFLQGYQPKTVGTSKLTPTMDAGNQTYMTLMKHAEILGKKVKEWDRSYDLEGIWGGKWLPIRGTQQPIATDFTVSAGDFYSRGPLAGTSTPCLTSTGNPVANFSGTLICPARPSEYHQPWAKADGVAAQANTGDTNSYGYPVRPLHGMGKVSNIFLGIESLPNQDGSLVPIIMDGYFDTEITVECSFGNDMYQNGAFYFNTPATGVSPEVDYSVPNPFAMHVNSNHNTYFGEWSRQAQIQPNNVGPGQSYGFGEMGFLGNSGIGMETIFTA